MKKEVYGWVFLVVFGLIGCSGGQLGSEPIPTLKKPLPGGSKGKHSGIGEIKAQIAAGHLTRADEVYAAWRTEHEDVSQVPRTIVALTKAHMEADEYLLARFYLNEYRRDFPSGKAREKIEYLGVRMLFLQYRKTRDDRLIDSFKAQAKAFKGMFPRSSYRAKIHSFSVKICQMQNAHYRELAEYYARRGKPKAAAFYREKIAH